jgi:hypothetical protein
VTRYRYDVLVGISHGVSENEDPDATIRRLVPSATDIKSLGHYLRTFCASSLSALPAFITECTTRLNLEPGLCEACNGEGTGLINGEPGHCLACQGSGNAPVAPAGPGERTCGQPNECGGSCIRARGHDGKHLCVGDEDNIPETCPA